MNSSTLVLYCIRSLLNGVSQGRPFVEVPRSRGVLELLVFLYKEGFIRSFRVKRFRVFVSLRYTKGTCSLVFLAAENFQVGAKSGKVTGNFTITLITSSQGALAGIHVTQYKSFGSALFYVSLFFNLIYLWFHSPVSTFLRYSRRFFWLFALAFFWWFFHGRPPSLRELTP